ncbi:MAG: GAF domain-containing protein [Anaerolineaceae bacterium]|nr:GAF domain-containing protein [Anaerolineaceae bacterium]
MNSSTKTLHLLLIAPPGDDTLHWDLTAQSNFRVSELVPGEQLADVIGQTHLDLIILDVSTREPSLETVLSTLAAAELPMPVVVIGADGHPPIANASSSVAGWISRPFSAADLTNLIQTVLAPSATGETPPAKLAELVETNRQLTNRVNELETLFEISRLVSSTLEVAEIPRLLLQRAAKIVEAECGSLALIDRQRSGVVFQLAYDAEGVEVKGLRNFVMPLGQGIVGLVAETGQPVIANEVRQHPAWSPLSDQMTGFTTKQLVAVPLIAEGEIIGVVELLNKKDGNFDQEDVDILTLVASSVASAIQNARQYESLKQANQALHQAHKQRVAAERWAVLGKAAANLAHRINNTTTLIPIAAQHTLELLAPVDLPPELRADIEGNLERIRRNSLYTVELATVLLRRFRRDPTDAHDVNELINKALSLVEMPVNIRLVTHLDPDLPPVDTSDLLTDVFVELIANAVKALSPGGGLLRIASFRAGRNRVSIQITDNGLGITAEDVSKIFDMFFTTTPTGLGFGLWWVKTFLEQQRGEITVDSVPNEHTTFTVTLPRNLPSLRSFQK